MGQAGAKQAGQTSLPGGCGRGDTPAVFHGSSTVPNDTTDTGERIKRRHTPLQFLVTESSRLYFFFFFNTWWQQDVQHRFEEGCFLGKCSVGFLCLWQCLSPHDACNYCMFALVSLKLLCTVTCHKAFLERTLWSLKLLRWVTWSQYWLPIDRSLPI